MRTCLLAMVVALGMAPCARAGTSVGPGDQARIQQVITAQIEAFRHDDGKAAFAFAAPNIHRKFGNGEVFLDVVRRAYPPVFRPRAFNFGALLTDDGAVTQKVTIVGPDGATSLALYDMEHEADGTWRIAGCSLAESAQLAI